MNGLKNGSSFARQDEIKGRRDTVYLLQEKDYCCETEKYVSSKFNVETNAIFI
jgi:hypothetical protein